MRKPTKKKKQSRARKAKPVDVGGHLLNPELYGEYLRALGQRNVTNPKDTYLRRSDMALDEVTHPLKPTSRSKEILFSLSRRIGECDTAIHQVAQWPWFNDKEFLRATALDLLQKAHEEIEFIAAAVRVYRLAVATQEGQHVQEWLRLDENLKLFARHASK